MKKGSKKIETGCCPRFDPKTWDKKTIKWEKKLFLKDRVFSFFHIPINFGGVMKRDVEMIEKAKAKDPHMIVLSDENSLFGADIYLSVKKNVPKAKMEKITGTFLSKVFEGSYSNMGKWVKEMQEYVKSKNKIMKKMYFYYTTCPKFAKVYGKNYVVILAKI